MSAATAVPAAPAAPIVVRAKVTEVHDGDTIRVDVPLGSTRRHDQILGWGHFVRAGNLYWNVPVRLARCNAPELPAPGGAEAQQALAIMCPAGSTVELRSHLPGVPALDTWGRVLAEVYPVTPLGLGQEAAATLIAEGHAAPWDGRGPKPVPSISAAVSLVQQQARLAAQDASYAVQDAREALAPAAPAEQVGTAYVSLTPVVHELAATGSQPSPVERVVRSAVQVILAECVAIPSAVGTLGLPVTVVAKIGAICGFIALVIAVAQNAIEAKTGVRLGLHRQ